MIKFLGGGNEKLEELLNAVMDDYAQVTRVMNFAHSMISISSHEKLTTIEENAARFMQREFSPKLPGYRNTPQHTDGRSELMANLHREYQTGKKRTKPSERFICARDE